MKFLFNNWKNLCAGIIALATVHTRADEQAWQIHGFIAQGLVETRTSNFFDADSDFSSDLTTAGLNGNYQLTDRWRAAGQVVYQNLGNNQSDSLRVDYGLIDYTAYTGKHSNGGIRAGRVRNTRGLYGQDLSLPFTQPSIFMPQGIYRDLLRQLNRSLDGVDIYFHHAAIWGEIYANVLVGKLPFNSTSSATTFGDSVDARQISDQSHYFDLKYMAPNGVTLGFTKAYLNVEWRFDPPTPLDDIHLVTKQDLFSLQYTGEEWELSAEYQLSRSESVLVPSSEEKRAPQSNRGDGYYLQARYFLSENWRLLMRYDALYRDTKDRYGRKIEELSGGSIQGWKRYQQDWTVGVSWEPTKNLKVMFELHAIEGTAATPPLTSFVPQTGAEINEKYWQMYAAQISYKF